MGLLNSEEGWTVTSNPVWLMVTVPTKALCLSGDTAVSRSSWALHFLLIWTMMFANITFESLESHPIKASLVQETLNPLLRLQNMHLCSYLLAVGDGSFSGSHQLLTNLSPMNLWPKWSVQVVLLTQLAGEGKNHSVSVTSLLHFNIWKKTKS